MIFRLLLLIINKTLPLTARSIGALFSRVKGYFPPKISGNDRVGHGVWIGGSPFSAIGSPLGRLARQEGILKRFSGRPIRHASRPDSLFETLLLRSNVDFGKDKRLGLSSPLMQNLIATCRRKAGADGVFAKPRHRPLAPLGRGAPRLPPGYVRAVCRMLRHRRSL